METNITNDDQINIIWMSNAPIIFQVQSNFNWLQELLMGVILGKNGMKHIFLCYRYVYTKVAVTTDYNIIGGCGMYNKLL